MARQWFEKGGTRKAPTEVPVADLKAYLANDGGADGKAALEGIREAEDRGGKLQIIDYGATPRITVQDANRGIIPSKNW